MSDIIYRTELGHQRDNKRRSWKTVTEGKKLVEEFKVAQILVKSEITGFPNLIN